VSAVVVAGALAQKPGNGGEAWVRLSWLRGIADLGVGVHLVEQADVAGDGPEAAWFAAVTAEAGLRGRATLLDGRGEPLHGPAVDGLAEDGAVLVDLSGSLADAALVAQFRRRTYVDLDPGWTQLWDAAGLLGDVLDRYDTHLTVGDAVDRCGLPLSGRHWRPVRPLVLLSDWDTAPVVPADGPLTTVASWRSPSGTMPFAGRELGGKARSWRPLAGLPAAVPQRCAAVVAAHPADDGDLDRLRAGGWDLLAPSAVATPADYRALVHASSGELSVAQELYVATRCGWTSDRTAAYLASGRPAVVQDTGFSSRLRDSPALRPFDTCAQAVAACRELAEACPQELAAAARALAEAVFSTRTVLPRVLDLAGVR
jgi:hypothetical protein